MGGAPVLDVTNCGSFTGVGPAAVDFLACKTGIDFDFQLTKVKLIDIQSYNFQVIWQAQILCFSEDPSTYRLREANPKNTISGTSAAGPKRTSRNITSMSAVEGKADSLCSL